jgi:hypothetical protein
MTTAVPLGMEVHLASGVDSQRSDSTATDRNLRGPLWRRLFVS